jgi:hypothetical protein
MLKMLLSAHLFGYLLLVPRGYSYSLSYRTAAMATSNSEVGILK